MRDEIIVGVVVGVAAGAVGAFVGNATIRRVQEQIHKEEVRDAEIEGYKRGHDSLATNPAKMRKLLEKLEGAPTEE